MSEREDRYQRVRTLLVAQLTEWSFQTTEDLGLDPVNVNPCRHFDADL